jgi:hypothetical protein
MQRLSASGEQDRSTALIQGVGNELKFNARQQNRVGDAGVIRMQTGFQTYKAVLEQAGIVFEEGLSRGEICQIEADYNFNFPPDLKEFLMFALPVSPNFLNWRSASRDQIIARLSSPYEGIYFDIEHNGFWLEEWGIQPSSRFDAFQKAKKAVKAAPKLIPIFGHRYIPDSPCKAGNPIFSVHQTDIIYYGTNLLNYIENEFFQYFGRGGYKLEGEIRKIDFWSDLVE